MTSLACCTDLTKASKVQCNEKGRSATFSNPNKEEFKKTRVDGCLLNNETAADYLITVDNVGQVIIELKGSNVDRATEQVTATANYLRDKRIRTGKLAALIVCSQYPRVDTKVQRAKIKFRQDFGAPLHIKTQNLEYKLERVLAFDGPL